MLPELALSLSQGQGPFDRSEFIHSGTIERMNAIIEHCNRGRVLQRQFHILSNAKLLFVMCGCPSCMDLDRSLWRHQTEMWYMSHGVNLK